MRTSVKVLIGVLAVVAALVAAEFGARAYAGSQVDKFYQGLAAAEDAYGFDPQGVPRPSADAADLESL